MSSQKEQTIRQQIVSHLENGPMTVRDISQAVGIMEKDVFHHLAFIEKTVKQQKKRIDMQPCYCMDCKFKFKDRKTFKKPGRCPRCRHERIASAVLWIVPRKA